MLKVGDRVRLKGDYGRPGYGPMWMTVTRLDHIAPGPGTAGGTFISVAIPTTNDGGGPGLQLVPSIMVDAVTKQLPRSEAA